MGKRHVNRQRNAIEDTILMSSIDDDADFESAMHAMDRRFEQRNRRSKRNRFGDYEEAERLNSQEDYWESYDEDLDFAD